MSVTFEQLTQRHPAEVNFTGLGCWDVFEFGGRLAGRVVFDMHQPPFIRGDGKECLFAPGFVIFPMGLVATKDGWRIDKGVVTSLTAHHQ